MQLAVVSLQLGSITNPGAAGGIKGEPGECKGARHLLQEIETGPVGQELED